MYKCWKCNTTLRVDIKQPGIKCEYCNEKIFFRDRPNVRKVLDGR